jgi:hypothetical protein
MDKEEFGMKRALALVLVLVFLVINMGCLKNESSEIGDDENQIDAIDPGGIGFELLPGDVIIESSWPKGYDSIEELLVDSDLVVLGKVGPILDVWDLVADDPRGITPILITAYEFTVESILFTRLPNQHDQITILQEGGTYKDVRYINLDDPPFAEGERAILFLFHIEDNVFRCLQPQARYIVYENYVFTPRFTNPADSVFSGRLKNNSLQEFLAAIQAAK